MTMQGKKHFNHDVERAPRRNSWEALELEERLQNGLKGLRTNMINRGFQFGEDHLVEGFLTAFLLFLHGIDGHLGRF